VIDHSQLAPSEKPPIEPSEDAIRLRSQQIWEREGCPEGCAWDHWISAKTELEAEQEHWMRAKAELEAQMEKTSNPHLPEPIRRKGDFVRSILVQAGAMMPKTSRSASPPAQREEIAPARGSDEAVPAGPHSPPLAPAKRSKQTTAAPSIICADIVLHGALESTGDIQLDGCVEGNVRSAVLVVGDQAVIQGEVIADDVTVRGFIRGSIRARKVLLCSGSRVEGGILYGIFSAEAGAQIEGHCRHADDPLSQENAPAATCGVPEEPVEALSEEVALSQTAA
jgi:cytoskeletal protein CcmA (bactofilin family)